MLAGTLIGLGTAAKLYPALLLVADRRSSPIRTPARAPTPVTAIVAAALSWAAVNVPVALAYHRGWAEFYRFSIDRPTERSTVWAIGRTLADGSLQDADASYWVPPGIAVALLFVRRDRRRGRPRAAGPRAARDWRSWRSSACSRSC